MLATQQCLLANGWMIREKVNHVHHYRLDDDPNLSSSLMIVDQVSQEYKAQMPYAGRSVSMNEIPNFYGSTVLPPYPQFIDADGRPMAAESRNREVFSIH